MDGRPVRLGKVVLRSEVVRSGATPEHSIGLEVYLRCIYNTKCFQNKRYQSKQLSHYLLDTRWPIGTQEAFGAAAEGPQPYFYASSPIIPPPTPHLARQSSTFWIEVSSSLLNFSYRPIIQVRHGLLTCLRHRTEARNASSYFLHAMKTRCLICDPSLRAALFF